jgi:G3E family GTPase
MSEVNIDAQFVENQNILSRTDEKLVEMSNGCICCTLREDLMIEVEKLANEGRFDYLLIESTGISEPVPVAQTFSFVDEENGIDLSKFSYVDTMVTVVDCFNFINDFGTDERLTDRDLTNLEGDDRAIVNLLTDQIEFANIIILNKTDLVHFKTVGLIRGVIKKLNPTAKIIESSYGKVPYTEILNTKLFDFDEAQNSAGWQKELEKGEHTPETEEYGISSFVFRDKRPFHPDRFWKYLNEDYPTTILRAKGLFWLLSRPNDAISFSQAGGSSKVEQAGVWWVSMAFASRVNHPSFIHNKEYIENKWHAKWGDRSNEIVFIGKDMNQNQIIAELEECLIQPNEMHLFDNKEQLEDSFPIA